MTTELNKTAAAAAVSAVYPANSEETINLKEKISELKKELNTPAWYFLERIEGRNVEYLSDAIWESADSQVDIYNYALLEWLSQGNNYQYMEDCVNEGLYCLDNRDYNFFSHVRCAQYMGLEEEIREDLEKVLLIWALDYIADSCEKSEISSEQYEEIENLDYWNMDSTDDIESAVDEIITPEEENEEENDSETPED